MRKRAAIDQIAREGAEKRLKRIVDRVKEDSPKILQYAVAARPGDIQNALRSLEQFINNELAS
jgi:vacuolar-type H+-ATPase subunit E/Vma4